MFNLACRIIADLSSSNLYPATFTKDSRYEFCDEEWKEEFSYNMWPWNKKNSDS